MRSSPRRRRELNKALAGQARQTPSDALPVSGGAQAARGQPSAILSDSRAEAHASGRVSDLELRAGERPSSLAMAESGAVGSVGGAPAAVDASRGWVVSNPDNRTLFLVDALGLIFRSYYALSKTTMSSRDMFDTRAVYGFTMVMLSILKKYAKGNPVAVVFEGKKLKGQQDFRTAAYPEYKAGRGPTPSGVIEAIPWAKRICKLMGLAVLEVDLFEADDTIGTLVRKAQTAGVRSVIVSMDKDFRQLLDGEHVKILRPGAGGSFEYVTEESFRKDFSNLHPSQYVDVLTLIGDTVDGLKGVPGIGARTAPRLIAQYGTLEGLLNAVRTYQSEQADLQRSGGKKDKSKSRSAAIDGLPLITKRILSSLVDKEQHALLVKTLISIRTNVPLDTVSWESLQRKCVDQDEAREVLDLLEFTNRNIAQKIFHCADDVDELNDFRTVKRKPGRAAKQVTSRWTELSNSTCSNDASAVVGTLPDANFPHSDRFWELGVDYASAPSTEEIDVHMRQAKGNVGVLPVVAKDGASENLAGIVFSISQGKGIFVKLTSTGRLPESVIQVLHDTRVEKRGWFLKTLYKHLVQGHGVVMRGKLFDNRIASELLHAGEAITDAKLASLYLGAGALDDWIGNRDHRLSPPRTAEGALRLCDIGRRLSDSLYSQIEESGLTYILDHVELPLIPVLGDMEMAGVPINSDGLEALEGHVRRRLRAIESSIKEIVPPFEDSEKIFRPSSRDDVARLIFDVWKLDLKVKRTSSGKFPVDKKVLSLLAESEGFEENYRKFGKLMLEYREAAKILSTYTKSLLSAIDLDGRIHTTFVQEAAATGRLSTSNPNLQSIPIRSSLGREVRRMVEPSGDFCILCADYSQIELRIIASLSGDGALKTAFKSGTDIHRAVAAKVFKVHSLAEVTDEQRRNAKEVNYGIPYGISAYGLGQHLGIPGREAKVLMSQFHEQFPHVKNFTEKLIQEARDAGYAKSMLGRRLPLPLIRHGGPGERKAAARVAVNMPIQGTQADMIKLAMIRIADRLRDAKAQSRLIMQIHDELVLEVHNSELEAVKSVVEEEMISALPLSGVDIVVNTGVGGSWLNATHA